MNRNTKPTKILSGLDKKKPNKQSSPQFDEAESDDDGSVEDKPQDNSQDGEEEQSASEESEDPQKPAARRKKTSTHKADPEVIKVPSSVHLTHNQSKHGFTTQQVKKSSTPTKSVQKNKSIPKIDSKKPTTSIEELSKQRQDKDSGPKKKPQSKTTKNVMTYEDPNGYDMGQDIISKLRSEFLDKKDQTLNLGDLDDNHDLEQEEDNKPQNTLEDSDNDDKLLFSTKKTPPPRSKSR